MSRHIPDRFEYLPYSRDDYDDYDLAWFTGGAQLFVVLA
jgi:hypothetical protein